MKTSGQRLEELRKERFASRRQAAEALGIPPTTYNQYEAGEREFTRHAERFARFFRVNLEWLLTGKGEMRGKSAMQSVEIHGVVGAGGAILSFDDDQIAIDTGDIALPPGDQIGAYIIRGDSGYPRFLDGEVLIFYKTARQPQELIDRQVIAQTLDGQRLVKTLRQGGRPGAFTLESFNAKPMRDIALLAVWEIYGLLFRAPYGA